MKLANTKASFGPVQVLEREDNRLRPRPSQNPGSHRRQLPSPQFFRREMGRAARRERNVHEREFCGLRLAGDFRPKTRENGRNSVRRPRHASLTDRNCEGFCRPGNRVGLLGLDGGGCRDRTDGHRSLASLQTRPAPQVVRASSETKAGSRRI